jgi:methionine-rich copper-binding protein CopC
MSRSARLAQALAGSVVAGVVLLGTASPAAAHADLLRSDPPSGTTADRAPRQVTFYFSEPVDPVFTRVSVRGTDNYAVAPKAVAEKPYLAELVAVIRARCAADLQGIELL